MQRIRRCSLWARYRVLFRQRSPCLPSNLIGSPGKLPGDALLCHAASQTSRVGTKSLLPMRDRVYRLRWQLRVQPVSKRLEQSLSRNIRIERTVTTKFCCARRVPRESILRQNFQRIVLTQPGSTIEISEANAVAVERRRCVRTRDSELSTYPPRRRQKVLSFR